MATIVAADGEGGVQANTLFWRVLPNSTKMYGTLKFLLSQGKLQNATPPTVSIQSQPIRNSSAVFAMRNMPRIQCISRCIDMWQITTFFSRK